MVEIIGTGSLIGALVGTVLALRDHHRELRTAHQRNSVMNRVLRHTIRNDINVIQAHVELAALVEDYVDHANDRFPDATVTASVPDTWEVQTAPQIRSVVDNLVENAVEHNDAAEPAVGIELEHRDEERIELRVRDDGPGIPPAQFEVPFADGEAHDNHGSGLGLWLVKWFADRHDGDIRLEENEPRGSVVCLALPTPTDPVH